jgi:hypothetical protein
MNYPTVIERKVRLEPVAHDTFIDKLPPAQPPAAPAVQTPPARP